MAEINPVQRPLPSPRVEELKRDPDRPPPNQSREEEPDARGEQPSNPHQIDEYA